MSHKPRISCLALAYLLPFAGVLGAVGPAHAQVFKFEEVVNGAAGSWQFFPIELPAGTDFLSAELSGGTGDADLYVRPSEQPTDTEFTCRPWLDGNSETCDTLSPQAGSWFVGINGFDDFSDVTLVVRWSVAVPMEPPAMEPPAMEPPAMEPPAMEPPAMEPPAMEPPAMEPPAMEPPAMEPPAMEPPAMEPPAMEPPAMEPPAAGLADWQQQMLDEHNVLRARHCAPAQTWDAELAAGAQAWAEQCVFEHSTGAWGENLFAGTNTTPLESVDGWYSEISNYNFAQPGFVAGTGHFTQLVWQASTRLGCGMARCPNIFPDFGGANYFVCRYAVAGNNVSPGQFEANVLPVPANGMCQ